MTQTIDIALYKTSAHLDAYSQSGTMDDPIFPKSSIEWDGEAGQVRDIQLFAQNDGNVDAFGVVVEVVDVDGTDETTWSKLASTQAGLSGATVGGSLAIGDLAVGASTNFWLRVQVPVGTGSENKTDLRVRAAASWSSSSSSCSSSQSSSSSSQSSSSSNSPSVSSSSSSSSSSSQSSSSSNSSSSSSSSSHQIRKGIQPFSATLIDPDSVQATVDTPTIMPFDDDPAPFGITLRKVGIKTKPASTYSVTFKRFADPVDATPVTIATVATSSSTEAETTTLDSANMAADTILMVDLPTTDIDELVVFGSYTVNQQSTSVSSSSSSSQSSSSSSST